MFFWLKNEWRKPLTVLQYLCWRYFHGSTHSSHSSLKFFSFLEVLASDGFQTSKILLKETRDKTVKDIYKSQSKGSISRTTQRQMVCWALQEFSRVNGRGEGWGYGFSQIFVEALINFLIFTYHSENSTSFKTTSKCITPSWTVATYAMTWNLPACTNSTFPNFYLITCRGFYLTKLACCSSAQCCSKRNFKWHLRNSQDLGYDRV